MDFLEGQIVSAEAEDAGMVSLAAMLTSPATLERLEAARRRNLRRHSIACTESSPLSEMMDLSNGQLARRKADLYNATPGYLNEKGPFGGYDCPDCLNRGDVMELDENGQPFLRECACMRKRRYLMNIRESGLSDMLTRYTFANWQCREPWQRSLLDMVQRFAARPHGWLCLSGTPGTGKTHLCTALCGALLEQGRAVRYMLWKETAIKAKAVVNDDEAYGAIVEPLKSVDVLYIDDFLKTRKPADPRSGQRIAPAAPTTGDGNFAADLIYARYNNARLITIISTEMTLGDMMSIDEGTASRIYERTKGGGYQSLERMPNWRLLNA